MWLWQKSGQQRDVVAFTEQDNDNIKMEYIKRVIKTVVKRLPKRIKAWRAFIAGLYIEEV
jgi:hypothetical protein